MSALSLIADYVKSGKLVRMLAQARSLTLPQVYGEMGRIMQEGLATYVPAIAAMVKACETIGDVCMKELISLRETIVREICELVGLDKVIQWVLDLLKKIPEWLLTLLQDVADVWQMLDHWSKGEFYLSELGAVLKNIASHWGSKIAAAASAAGKAILKAAAAVGRGFLWLAEKNKAAQAWIFDRVEQVENAFRSIGKTALTGILREIGLDEVADAVDNAVDWIGDVIKESIKTTTCVLSFGMLC